MASTENHKVRDEANPTKCEELMRNNDEWGGTIPPLPVAVRVIRSRPNARKKTMTANQPSCVDEKESVCRQLQFVSLSACVEMEYTVIDSTTKAAQLAPDPRMKWARLGSTSALGCACSTSQQTRGYEQHATLTKHPRANPFQLCVVMKAPFDGKFECDETEAADGRGHIGQDANLGEWRRGHRLCRLWQNRPVRKMRRVKRVLLQIWASEEGFDQAKSRGAGAGNFVWLARKFRAKTAGRQVSGGPLRKHAKKMVCSWENGNESHAKYSLETDWQSIARS